MTVMNVVHMRVKPGHEYDFINIHEEMPSSEITGLKHFWLIRSGERSLIVVGDWESPEAIPAARPAMIANQGRLRPIPENLGDGRGDRALVRASGALLARLSARRTFAESCPPQVTPCIW